jgi:hypothetical protein
VKRATAAQQFMLAGGRIFPILSKMLMESRQFNYVRD